MISTDLTKQPKSIEEWTETLLAQELPIFSNTAQKIYRSLNDTKKGALDLAAIIMQDPNLTAKLLKIGNSSYYNPSRQKMSTVTRAIILLGAECIRELTIACSFIESILNSSNKLRANQEIAQAIHAAVQAREFAIAMHDELPEEVFVAALLHNIAHIAFWCSNHPQTEQINYLLETRKISVQDAEKQILGFSLRELSKKLCKSWHLGGLIEESICRPESTHPRIKLVLMGSEISAALKLGWESTAMQNCLHKLEKLTGDTPEAIIVKIKNNTQSAIKVAKQFGAEDASKFISSEVLELAEDEIDTHEFDKKQIQFQVLQDISNHISGQINLNQLFEMVLEGIHRGIEMDRTLFVLLSPDKQTLNEKLALGWIKQNRSEKILIQNQETEGNLFFYALHQQEGLWIEHNHYQHLYTKQIINIFGKNDSFIFPVHIDHKAIGLIYCDRSINKAPLTQSDFTTAKHFARQVNIGLTLYHIKKH
ncbi:HDOD domain-containing protein [Methylomonas sp. AM2-LC]|uniref:HDOD domain-containing protein n=1 Tax=Methylomonas sp. AM2-LC TaxID=3153301 RepID=UPI0032677126